MKTKSLLLLAALATASSFVRPLAAAPLTSPTAVHLKPDAASPAFATLKPGTEPVAATGVPAAPAGWMAVEVPGPHEVYVQNKEITKALDVRPGAELRSGPKADTPVLTTARKDDPLNIIGLHGRWTQLRLERPLVGYIPAPTAAATSLPSSAVAAPLPVASAPASAPRPAMAPGANAPRPMAASPSAPTAYGAESAGQAAPMVNLGDGGASALPRMFQGRFVSTRNPFKPRRPYDWALTDEGGSRFAYLDVSRLLQTQQIEAYVDRTVAVFGAARPIPGTKDFVVVVESLQLR